MTSAGPGLAGVVLAAGAGTRLRPLTTLRPKALCPVGTVPLLDLALARLTPLAGSGPSALAVNAHAFAEAVATHVAGRAHVSVERGEALGTAGALGALREWLDGRHVAVTNADAYLPGGLGTLAEGWDAARSRLLCAPVAGAGTSRRCGPACGTSARACSRGRRSPASSRHRRACSRCSGAQSCRPGSSNS